MAVQYYHPLLQRLLCADISALAEKHCDILVPDEGAQYDRLVEINLDEVREMISTCRSVGGILCHESRASGAHT